MSSKARLAVAAAIVAVGVAVVAVVASRGNPSSGAGTTATTTTATTTAAPAIGATVAGGSSGGRLTTAAPAVTTAPRRATTSSPARTTTTTSRPTTTRPPGSSTIPNGIGTIARSALPPEGRTTLELIVKGPPFPYRQDGVVFSNREGHLPKKASGYYHEYTVVTPGSPDRGARRIITGTEGERYYTDDHYATFRFVVDG